MVRTAPSLAARTGGEALVTGDTLEQGAGQALANMVAVDVAATLPVLRPLLGWEKQEIIERRGPSAPPMSRSYPTRTAAVCSPRAGSPPAPSCRSCARSSGASISTR